jgi:hypothetical protein
MASDTSPAFARGMGRSPTAPMGRVAAALLRLGDALFGREDDANQSAAWRLKYLAVAMLLAAIIVGRRLDAITNPQFWAEDGYIYFVQNAMLGFPRALAQLYNGYPNLTQRLIAFVGGLGPVVAAPRIYTSISIALTAFGLASFSLPAFRHVVRSDGLRVLFCVATVSLPVDQEMLSNVANLGWYLAIWLSLLSVMRLPRHRWHTMLLALAGSAAIFSTPLAAVNVPLWLLRACRGALRADRRELGFALVLLAAFATVAVLTGGFGATPSVPLLDGTLHVTLGSYLDRLAFRAAALVLPPQDWAALVATGMSRVYHLAAILLVALFAVCGVGGFRNVTVLIVALYLAFGGMLITLVGRAALNLLAPYTLPTRYTLNPAAMLLLAVVVAIDALRSGLPRIASTTALVGMFAWAWRASFVVEPFLDQHWMTYVPQLDSVLRNKCPAHLVVPMNPPWAPLVVDWSPLYPEVEIPPNRILGSLGGYGSFRQSFASRCDGLNQVHFHLAAPASSQGTVSVRLFDGSRPVASARVPRAQLTARGWQPFCFRPIEGSSGRRYTAVLRAIANDPTASVMVLGSETDVYPDGEAWFANEPVDGDASFRYACSPVDPTDSRPRDADGEEP